MRKSIEQKAFCSAVRVQYNKQTSKVGAVHQLHANVSFGQDADHPVLNEVHLLADSALSDDVVSGLEDFESQFGQHGCHKVGVSIGKQRHGRHQLTAIKVDYFLYGNREPHWISRICLGI